MKICFLSGLKEAAGRQELELEYEGPLSNLLETLCESQGPDLRGLVMDADDPGARSSYVKILVDGRDVREDDPELDGTETVFLFLPIAGG